MTARGPAAVWRPVVRPKPVEAPEPPTPKRDRLTDSLTQEEVQFIIDSYESLTAHEQAARLERPKYLVINRRTVLVRQGLLDKHRRAYLPPNCAAGDARRH